MTEPTSDEALEAYGLVDRVKAIPPDRREDFLRIRCEGRPGLRVAVDRLLQRVGSSDDWEAGAPLDPHDARPDLIEKDLDGFLVRKRLGQGGMGTVYLAEQRDPHRMVALKALNARWPDQAQERRFRQECEVLERLSHPCIAAIFHQGTWAGPGGLAIPYFVMEYVNGARNLVDYCRHHRLALADRLRMVIKVAEALHHGHELGVVHRDLKPDNLLVDHEGQPRIIDFGLARVLDPDRTRLSGPLERRALVGTLTYITPEQLDPHLGEVDARTDVYALCLVLFELLTDRRAIQLQSDDLVASLKELATVQIPRLRDLDPQLPNELEAVLARALARQPDLRPATALVLARDLEGCVERLGTVPDRSDAPSARRSLRSTVAAGALATSLLGAVVYCTWNPEDSTHARTTDRTPASDGTTRGLARGIERPPDVADPARTSAPDFAHPSWIIDSGSQGTTIQLPSAAENACVDCLSIRSGTSTVRGGKLRVPGDDFRVSLRVASQRSSRAELTLEEAFVHASQLARIGEASGSFGIVRVTQGSQLFLRKDGPANPWVPNEPETSVGYEGAGQLHVTSGSRVRAANFLTVGGTCLPIRGPVETPPANGPRREGLLRVCDPGSEAYCWHLVVGRQCHGQVDVESHGRIIAQHSVTLGDLPGAQGVLSVRNAEVNCLPHHAGGRCMAVGRRGTGVVNLDGGRIQVDGRTDIAAGDDGVGRLNLRQGLLSTRELHLALRGSSRAFLHLNGQAVVETDVLEAGEGGSAEIQLSQDSTLRTRSPAHLGVHCSLVTAGGTVQVPELRLDGMMRAAGGTVRGTLVVGGSLDLLLPPNHGRALVALRIEEDLRFTDSAILRLHVNRTGTPWVEVHGNAQLGGTLRVLGEPADAREQILLRAESLDGRFQPIELPPELEGWSLRISATTCSLVPPT